MSSQLTVYKASAGSGKTFTLAREYMTLVIANPASYRTILAVTFTNKATEEMKMRILGKLYEIAHGLPEANDYVNQIQQALPYLSSKQIQKNAESALHLLIHNYNYFRVMTIDTFFQNVLRNLARELDLTANLRIELNDYQIEQQAVDELIEGLEDTDRLLFWIMDYIKENIDDDKSWNVIGQIKKFGENIFKDYYKAHADKLTDLMEQEDFFKDFTDRMKKMRSKAKEQLKEIAATFFDSLEEEGFTSDDLAGKTRGIWSYFNKLKNGKYTDDDMLFVVDELERSLHPKLTQHFLKLFMEAHGEDRVQLIFTTHEDTIMDQELFRRDEIWFVERDGFNSSKIYSLDRFKERYDKKLSKAYLEGRYGAIPVFKQFNFLDKEDY